MMPYLQRKHEATLKTFMTDGFNPAKIANFLLASPDRLAVAADWRS